MTSPVNTFAPIARPPIAPPVSSWGAAPPPPVAPVQPPAPAVTPSLQLPKFDNIEMLDLTPKTYTDEEAVACSLENPESCEACQ